MSCFETTCAGHEAERIKTGFYRFLEKHAVPATADVSIHTEVLGHAQRCTVRLWSPQAVADFQRHLQSFEMPEPRGLAPRFGMTG